MVSIPPPTPLPPARTRAADDARASRNPVKPKAAASLVLLDMREPVPRVLMGRRNASLRFMPGKFVFPGGRVEASDADIVAADSLPRSVAASLAKRNRRDAPTPDALALAAIRETFEETGLLIGAKAALPSQPIPHGWMDFVSLGFLPRIGPLSFLARAITPPHLPRRFDTRFFVADAAAVAHRVEGVAHADAELVELVWLPIAEAERLDLGNITGAILREAARRFTAGLAAESPVPFFHFRNRRFLRDEL
jgi:8-oxo-dGTP pyrophosphatase MutT (NUDIX family)